MYLMEGAHENAQRKAQLHYFDKVMKLKEGIELMHSIELWERKRAQGWK